MNDGEMDERIQEIDRKMQKAFEEHVKLIQNLEKEKREIVVSLTAESVKLIPDYKYIEKYFVYNPNKNLYVQNKDFNNTDIIEIKVIHDYRDGEVTLHFRDQLKKDFDERSFGSFKTLIQAAANKAQSASTRARNQLSIFCNILEEIHNDEAEKK